MNKDESWNEFLGWVAFRGEGIIAKNDRLAQRKIIKYNHLLESGLLFYSVAAMSRSLANLRAAGYPIDAARAATALSPYTTAHYFRFGLFVLDLNRECRT